MKNARLRGVICVIAASICYGITPILSNTALRGGLPADFLLRLLGYVPGSIVASQAAGMTNESVVGLCMAIACILSLFTCAIAKKPLRVTKKQAWQLALAGGGGFTATGLLISYAYLCIPAGTTIVLHFTYPIVVAVASALLFHERLSPVKLLALAAAMIGIALISGFSVVSAFGGNPALGIPLALLSGVAYAAYFIAGRRASYSTLDPSVSNVYITGASAAICFIIAAVTGRFQLPSSLFMWIVLVLEGVIAYLIGVRLLLHGIRLLGASTASALNTLEPVFASITSVLVFAEPMGWLKIVGAGLTLAAAVVTILTSKRKSSAL